MATEMITLKLDDKFLKIVDNAVRKEGYHNRTEFIRTALREKLENIKLKRAMIELAHLKGKAKKKVSEKEYEKARLKTFEMLEKEI